MFFFLNLVLELIIIENFMYYNAFWSSFEIFKVTFKNLCFKSTSLKKQKYTNLKNNINNCLKSFEKLKFICNSRTSYKILKIIFKV